MPPKQQRIVVQRGGSSGGPESKGALRSTYDTVTSDENAAVVRSILAFGAAVALISSSWAELLLPPLE